ncbi:MAG: DUF3552 domain-containing protein, partial [Bacteroidetes bacterium]|nr:DUF3552 domain-containing protein [Bacteroidota bacterium]
MEIYLVVIFVMLSFGGGIAAMFVINNNMLKSKAEKIVKDAEAQAEITKKDKMLEAKEKFLSLKSEHEKEVQTRNAQIIQNENKLKQMENTLKQKTDAVTKKDQELEQVKQSLNSQLETVKSKQTEVDKIVQNQVKQLEKIAGLTAAEAKNQMVETFQEEAKTEALSRIKEIVDEAKLTASKEAKKIVLSTIQRTAAEHAIENSVSVFNIDNDEMKGRIIGREGRNIRALEAATGVEIIVDDTPEAIILSCFDPI